VDGPHIAAMNIDGPPVWGEPKEAIVKLGPINQAGSMWSEKVSGDTYYLGDRKFVLAHGSSVFVREGEDYVPATAEDKDAVLALRCEDALIFENRRHYALQASEGNNALATVLFHSACFLDGEPSLASLKEHPELKIAQVGRNASHYFYLGASEDGKLFKLSMDVFAYYEGEDDALWCRELTPEQPAGYMGHA